MFARTLTALILCAAPALGQPTMSYPADVPPACPPCPLPKIEPNPLLGTWYHERPGCVVSLTCTHDELKFAVCEGTGPARTTTAHYKVTPDGLAFGAVTGTTGPATLVDAPFSFRFRVTSEGLMVSAFRSEPTAEDARYSGLFKCAPGGKVPTPRGAAGTGLVPVVGSAPAAPPVLAPALDGPPPAAPKRPNAGAPADGFKVLADEAFGSLLQQSGVLPKPKKDETWIGGMTLPSGRYLENYPRYVSPDPVFPLPCELATVKAAPAKKLAHVGTWHRDLGPMTCVVTIDADHVTVTGTAADEENGKPVRYELVITGDYHLSRDGTTLVGLVTGLDVTVTGANRREWNQFEEVTNLQKAFVGQPFAITVRAYGDVLVIGDVRVAGAGDAKLGGEAAMVAGRYKRAEPKPVPRATGAAAPRIPTARAPSADPNERMTELLKQTEDLRLIQSEWRQFWFPDAPSKLPPARVHGGMR